MITMASPKLVNSCHKIEETVWSNKDQFENTPSLPVISIDTKSSKIDNTKATSNDVELHTWTIASKFEPKDASIVENESKPINSQQILPTRIGSGAEDSIISGTDSTSARASFSHLIHEDSNLSGASTFSGPISTSGYMPYSGNISLRSESSTTSTHSFAFPILQPEWNSSPVKMAKANRSRTWKHRWRTAFICCKF